MRRWFNIALLNFGIAALIGCVLRAIYIWEIPFIRFKPLLNAHSHVAMLGWAFIALRMPISRVSSAVRPEAFSSARIAKASTAPNSNTSTTTGMVTITAAAAIGPFGASNCEAPENSPNAAGTGREALP